MRRLIVSFQTVLRLKCIEDPGIVAFGIASALEELLATLSTHALHAKVDSTDVEPLRTTAESLTGEASQLVEAVRKELPSSRLCHDEQIRLAIHDHLADQLAALQTRVHTQLESVSLRTSWNYLVLPVLEVVQSRGRSSHHLLTSVQPSEEQIRQAHEQILTSMLMTVQDLDRLQPASEVPSGDTGAGQLPKFMCTTETRFQSLRLQAFRLPTILDHFKSLFQLIYKSQKYDQQRSTTACLQRVLAFTQPVHNMLLHSLSESAQWHAALVKVLLLVENSLLELSEKGFCRPNESEDDGTGGTQGEGEMDLSEGMGMGSGKGAQDVSNQIENEEQVQGLQNDATEEEEEGPEDGSDKDAEGIDMSGGLDPEADDARTEDVEKSEEDGDDKKDDGDDQEDPEDAVDNVDPLASTAVDEKFWGDQDQDPSKQTDEQTAQEAQQSTEQQSEGNMGERQNHSSGDANDTQKDEPESNSPDTNSEDLPSDQPQTQNETVDMPEGEHLDMPEDLDLEGDQEDQEMHSEAGDDGEWHNFLKKGHV